MKRSVLLSILALVVIASTVRAQAPQRMSYQSVLRDNANQLIANKLVRLRVSMLSDSMNATPVFTETHQVTTNAQGLIQVEIGGGAVVTGSYASIPWSRGRLYIKTDVDPAGGTNYTLTSTTQLLSVPYAQYAGDLPVSKSGDTVRIGNAKLLVPGSVLLSSGAGNAPASLSEGLVAYYPFNGNANDMSGNGNHGVVNGAVLTPDRFNMENSAYQFDGQNDDIRISLASINNKFPTGSNISINAWVKTSDKNGPLLSFREPSVFDLNIGTLADVLTAPGRIGMIIRDDPTCCGLGNNVFGSDISDDSWHMVTMTRNGQQNGLINIYVDTVLVATSGQGQNGQLSFTTGLLSIGSEQSWIQVNYQTSTDQEYLSGRIDDLRVYSKNLSKDEIISLFGLK